MERNMRNNKGQFIKGIPAKNRHKIGDITIRTRHKRGGKNRAFIKIDEPNKWVLLARYLWESKNGKIPPGFGIHHIDGNSLNDNLNNLLIVNKAEHLKIHRKEFNDKRKINLANARRKLKWSTKSATKITGRHPKNCQCLLHMGSK